MEEEITPIANEPVTEPPKLTLSDKAIIDLSETSKWTMFLSILGLIFTGLIVAAGLYMGSIMSMVGEQFDVLPTGVGAGIGIAFGIVYILMGLLYFFPAWYLYKFSQKLKTALASKDNEALNAAFNNQKSFYKFWGILMIVFLGIYTLFGLIALVTALAI